MRLLQSAVRIESNGSGSGHGSAFPDRKALPPCSCAAPGEIIESRVAEDSSTRSGSRYSFARGLAGLSGRGRGPRRVPAPRPFVKRTEDLKSPCDAPRSGRIRPGVFSVHTPCLIHFNFLDWLLLAVAHVVQKIREISDLRDSDNSQTSFR